MYPTYRFNKSGSQLRVENEEEDRALAGEWFDHPPTEDEADTRFPVSTRVDETDEVDAMLAEEESSEGDEENESEDGTPRRKKKKKK